jgi:hypothetical protein
MRTLHTSNSQYILSTQCIPFPKIPKLHYNTLLTTGCIYMFQEVTQHGGECESNSKMSPHEFQREGLELQG